MFCPSIIERYLLQENLNYDHNAINFVIFWEVFFVIFNDARLNREFSIPNPVVVRT